MATDTDAPHAAAAHVSAHDVRYDETALPPLTSATAVFGDSAQRVATAMTPVFTARERAGQLPHVVSNVSAFLDVAHAPRWTIPRACEYGHLSMLPRLASREPADMNKHYRAQLFSKGLVSAAQRGDLPIVQWLCCSYCPSAFAWKGMEAAAEAGQLSVLQWLVAHYNYMQWDDILVQNVAANGHLDVLQWIYEQPNHAECSSQVVSRAVENDHLHVVTWLLERYPEYARKGGYGISVAICSGDIERVQRLKDLGLEFDFSSNVFVLPAVRSGRLEMVQYIYELVRSAAPDVVTKLMRDPESRCLTAAAASGHLDIVQWLHKQQSDDDVVRDLTKAPERIDSQETMSLFGAKRTSGFRDDAMHRAAVNGHLDVIKWLHEHPLQSCSCDTMDRAAAFGHLEVVKWLHKHRTEGCTTAAMDGAAGGGHLEIVQWLHANRTEGCTTRAMDEAASNGHLEIVKWLHAHRTEGCTTRAMDGAASNGHLEIFKWLHANRSEGCTAYTMDGAAFCGHLELVQWLHAHRTEGCTTLAMDNAAGGGHLEIVQWLHANRTEGCTTRAMDGAASNGHLEIVKWLHDHRTEGCTKWAMDGAAGGGHLEVVQWLHANRTEGCTDIAAQFAIMGERYEMLQWLVDECADTVLTDRPLSTLQYRWGLNYILDRIERDRAARLEATTDRLQA